MALAAWTGPRLLGSAAVAAGLTFGVAAVPSPKSAAGPSELRALVTDYVHGRLERHPETGTAMGLRGFDGRLAPGTSLARTEEREWLATLATRLERVPRSGLEPGPALERDLLETRIATDRFGLDIDRAWERDPGAVLRVLRGALTGAAAEGPGDCARLQATMRRLGAVPERLRAAMVDLTSAGREETVRAIAEAGTLLSLHRAGFGFTPRDCREPRLQADFAQSDSTSLGALAAYREYLENGVMARATARAPWGREKLSAWFAATQRETLGIEALSELVRAEIAALCARLGATDAPVASAPDGAKEAPPPDKRARGRGHASDLRRLAAAEALGDDAARRAWDLTTSPEALAAELAPQDPTVVRDLALVQLGFFRRLFAVLARHADGLDSAATAGWLVAHAMAEPTDAARETASAWDDPAVALEALRAWRVREAREQAITKLGKAFDAGAFASAVRENGPLPTGLLRKAILESLEERPARSRRPAS